MERDILRCQPRPGGYIPKDTVARCSLSYNGILHISSFDAMNNVHQLHLVEGSDFRRFPNARWSPWPVSKFDIFKRSGDSCPCFRLCFESQSSLLISTQDVFPPPETPNLTLSNSGFSNDNTSYRLPSPRITNSILVLYSNAAILLLQPVKSRMAVRHSSQECSRSLSEARIWNSIWWRSNW